jgi:hypothetical protein
MTLKEKFIKCKNKYDEYYILPVVDDAEQLVKIADDFAIDFADWFFFNYTEEVFYDNDYTKKQLEIYKIEKGL